MGDPYNKTSDTSKNVGDNWEGIDMPRKIEEGSHVRLVGLPEWLLKDLPEEERREMRSFVGRNAVVQQIDSAGYFWIGFGFTTETEDAAHYTGHNFCVTREFLELIDD